MSSAILLIAHGSRRAQANDDLRVVAETLSQRVNEKIVEIAYLELAEPDIPSGLQACVEKGATSIKMLPYFLSAGSHVSGDLKRFREQFQQKHSNVTCVLCPPLGLHPLMIDVLLNRLKEVADS